MQKTIHPALPPGRLPRPERGFAFLSRSTLTSDRTIEWEDGHTYPLVDVDVSSASHPFYTGRGPRPRHRRSRRALQAALRKPLMSAHCQLTGVAPVFGNRISHSHRRTRRRFDPNIQSRRYWVPTEGRSVRLTLSARGIKTIDRIGIDAAMARMRARGERV